MIEIDFFSVEGNKRLFKTNSNPCPTTDDLTDWNKLHMKYFNTYLSHKNYLRHSLTSLFTISDISWTRSQTWEEQKKSLSALHNHAYLSLGFWVWLENKYSSFD